LSRPNYEAYICKYRQLDAKPVENARDEGPQDPSSFIQRLADTSCISQLAKGEAHLDTKHDVSTSHKAAAINRVLQSQCEPPFLPSGSSNPNFVSNVEVADTIATALELFYELLPKESTSTTWQSLAHHINSGRILPSTTLDSEKDHSGLIHLLETFSYEPYISLCAQICKVVALRTQVEDITSKFRQTSSRSTTHGTIVSLLEAGVMDTVAVSSLVQESLSQTLGRQAGREAWDHRLWCLGTTRNATGNLGQVEPRQSFGC
jgi:DNA-binding XRE family transcriptional regulator